MMMKTVNFYIYVSDGTNAHEAGIFMNTTVKTKKSKICESMERSLLLRSREISCDWWNLTFRYYFNKIPLKDSYTSTYFFKINSWSQINIFVFIIDECMEVLIESRNQKLCWRHNTWTIYSKLFVKCLIGLLVGFCLNGTQTSETNTWYEEPKCIRNRASMGFKSVLDFLQKKIIS
jgi:hypothetical protein